MNILELRGFLLEALGGYDTSDELVEQMEEMDMTIGTLDRDVYMTNDHGLEIVVGEQVFVLKIHEVN